MIEPLLTIALLIVCACSLATVALYMSMNRLIEALFEYERMQFQQLHEKIGLFRAQDFEQHEFTRERIAQVKTRLADEERDDQAKKRRENAH